MALTSLVLKPVEASTLGVSNAFVPPELSVDRKTGEKNTAVTTYNMSQAVFFPNVLCSGAWCMQKKYLANCSLGGMSIL